MKDFLRRFFGVLLSVTMIFTSCVFPVFSVADEAQTGTVTEDTESILRLEVLKQLYEEMQQWVSENEGKELIDAPSAEIFQERVNALSGKERGVLVDQLIPGLYAILANETTGELELVETAQADALMEQTSVPGAENAQLTGLEDAVTPDQQLGGEGGSEIELPNLDPAGLVDELDQIPDDADLDLDGPEDDSDDPTADLDLEDVDDLDQVDDPEANEDLEQVDDPEDVDALEQVDELEDVDDLDQVDDLEAVDDLDQVDELKDADTLEQVDDPEADKDLEKDEELEDVDEPEQIDDSEADKDLEKDDELEDVDDPEQVGDPEADKDLEKDDELEDVDDPENAEEAGDQDQDEQQNDEQNIQSQDVSVTVNTETDKSVETSEEPADETDETVTVYTVTFEVGGDIPEGYAAPEAVTTAGGAQVDVPAAGSFEGYEFSGWFSEDVSVDGAFTMPENDVIISGEWEKQEYTVRYEYDETAPDGTVLPESGTYAFGDEVTVTDPQMEGYTFNGWTSEEVSVDGGVFRMPAGDVTLTGSWSAIQAPRPKMLKMGLKKNNLLGSPNLGDETNGNGENEPIAQIAKPAIQVTTDNNKIIITITCTTEGADIYYTYDGSAPVPDANKYAGPFEAPDDSRIIRAIAVKGELVSDEASASANPLNPLKTIDYETHGFEGSYDGNQHGITVTVTAPENATIKYGETKGSYTSDDSPRVQDANEDNPKIVYYQITADGYEPVTGQATIKVKRADPTVTVSRTTDSLVFNTRPHSLIQAANSYTSGGTISFAVTTSENAASDALTWESSPQATDAGTYYVWYKVDGGKNYNDIGPTRVDGSVTISNATMTVEPVTYAGVYDRTWHSGGAKVTSRSGETDIEITDAELKYSVKNGETWSEWTDEAPSITNVGTITYKVKASKVNYGDVESNETTLTVTPAPATAAFKNGEHVVVYDGAEWSTRIGINSDRSEVTQHVDVKATLGDGSTSSTYLLKPEEEEVEWSINPATVTNAGTYTLTVTLKSENFIFDTEDKQTKDLTFTVNPAIASVTFDNDTDYYDRAPWNNRIGLNDNGERYNHNIVVTADLGGQDPYQLNATGELPEISMSVNDGEAAIEANTEGYTVTLTAGNNFCFTSSESSVSRTTTVKFKVLPAVISSPAKFDTPSVVYDREDWAERMHECADPYKKEDGTIQLIVFANENRGEDKEAAKIQLKAGEYSITKPEGGLTEVYRTGGADNPHPYDVEWTLTDKANFVIASDVEQTAPFMITPAVISGVKINGEAAAEIDYRAWDWQNSVKTDGTATPADELVSTAKDQIIFLVTAELSESDQVAKPAEINLRMEPMLNVGEYVIEVLLEDDNNFEWDEEAEHTVTLTVKRHEVNPLTFSKSYITDSGETTADGAGGTFIFGAADSILEFTAEPGEVLLISLDDGTAKEYTVDGTRFEKHGEKNEPVKVTFTVSETGNVTLTSGAAGDAALGSLADNEKHILTISYKDAANLYDTNEEADPAILTNGVRFDNTAPIIELLSYKNREETATVVAHESGYLDGFYAGPDTSVNRLVDADQGIQIDVADAEGATTQQEVRLNWNGSGSPSLIHSGSTTLEYRDLAGNVTRLDFAEPSQSSGIEFEVELVPSKKENNGYLDSSEMAERDVLELTISGQPYEAVAVSFDGYSGMNYSFTMPGDGGAWSAGAAPTSYSEKVSLAGVAQGQQINFSVKYDDLIGSYEDYFYYDNVVDPVILTSLPITEDMFILSGIVEYKAYSVRVFVNGQQIPSSNVKLDAFGVFTALLPMLTEGDQITIVVTDLANNTQTFGPYPVGPMTNSKTLKGYSMGKVYTTAHQTKENETPDWVMVTKLGEDELQAGITLPLVAANSFRYGTVTLKLEGGQVVAEPELLEGATVVGDSYVGVISTKNADGDFYRQFMGTSGRPGATIEAGQGEYYVCFQQQVTLESSLMESSFQLENGGDNADRQLYLKCQRRQRLTAEQE